jgi:hypothetical protein
MFSFPSYPTLEFLTAHLILQSSILPSLLELLRRFVRACRAPGQPEKRALTSRHREERIKREKHEKFEKRT